MSRSAHFCQRTENPFGNKSQQLEAITFVNPVPGAEGMTPRLLMTHPHLPRVGGEAEGNSSGRFLLTGADILPIVQRF